MTKLNEFLGGLVKDLSQSQVTSDLTSMELLSQYKSHELLKHMEVPRVSIKNIDVKLKFVVDNVGSLELTEKAIRLAEDRWVLKLQTELLPLLLKDKTLKSAGINDSILTAIFRSVENPRFKMKKALRGESENYHISESVSYALNIIKSLPAVERKKLPTLREIKTSARKMVSKLYMDSRSELHKTAVAQSASEIDIEILVDRKTLSDTPNEEIQEVSFSFEMDMIKSVADETIQGKK